MELALDGCTRKDLISLNICGLAGINPRNVKAQYRDKSKIYHADVNAVAQLEPDWIQPKAKRAMPIISPSYEFTESLRYIHR